MSSVPSVAEILHPLLTGNCVGCICVVRRIAVQLLPLKATVTLFFFEQLICAHKTRKPCGDYVLYVPIESVIVDYIQCGYLGEIDVTGEVVVRINICS